MGGCDLSFEKGKENCPHCSWAACVRLSQERVARDMWMSFGPAVMGSRDPSHSLRRETWCNGWGRVSDSPASGVQKHIQPHTRGALLQ